MPTIGKRIRESSNGSVASYDAEHGRMLEENALFNEEVATLKEAAWFAKEALIQLSGGHFVHEYEQDRILIELHVSSIRHHSRRLLQLD